jgi:DNA-binding NtrC family response regulator
MSMTSVSPARGGRDELENGSHGADPQSQPGISVLVVDDEPGMRSFLKRGLAKRFALVEVAESVDEAEALRQRCHFDLVISDIRLPGRSGLEWVESLREQGAQTAVIFITAHADLDTAIGALRAGADDFVLKPFRSEQLMAAVERCLERQRMARENFLLRRQVGSRGEALGMVGECEVMRDVCDVIKRVAPMPSVVLIEGESGTGKELAARAIHQWSGRSGSFVPLNCGAISPELLESELFGHVKGAFTSAHQARDGLFSYAHGGSLFLDEIGEMPLAMQTKLLRVLEDRKIRPVGANREVPVDVRVIAASNRDLSEAVRAGEFREDLFYRLNVLSIRMPTLRERMDDLPVLADYFQRELAREMGIQPVPIDGAELAKLRMYNWPGNVREFKNVIERSLLLGRAPSSCLSCAPTQANIPAVELMADDLSLAAVEKRHILRVLDGAGGNKSEAARRLGISRKTLERKLQLWRSEPEPA